VLISAAFRASSRAAIPARIARSRVVGWQSGWQLPPRHRARYIVAMARYHIVGPLGPEVITYDMVPGDDPSRRAADGSPVTGSDRIAYVSRVPGSGDQELCAGGARVAA